MALINDRDVLLQATVPRVLGSEGTVFLLLTSDFQSFDVNAAGVATPSTITFEAHPFQLPQNITTWSVSAGATLTGTGNTRSLAFSDLTVKSATITATIVSNGVTYSESKTVSQYHEGIIGIRNKQHVYAAGSSWSDATANAAVTAPAMQGDEVTIGDGVSFILSKIYDGTAWNPDGSVIDGSLTVTNSITAASINTSGLTIKDAAGITIFSATTPLAGTYIANAAITNAKIDNAAVTTAKIANASITNALIGNTEITSAKIGTAEVATLNIAGQAVTIPVSAYSASGVDIGGGGSHVVISAGITSTGAPIFITATSLVEITDTNNAGATVEILRDSTVIYTGLFSPYGQGSGETVRSSCALSLTDTTSAGAHTYYFQFKSAAAGTSYNNSIMLLETKR